MKRSQPRRDWTDARAKVDTEGACRICGINRGLQAAHTVGRAYDEKRGSTRYVDPDGVVPLCPPCHHDFDAHQVDLAGRLTLDEELYAVRVLGSIEQARRRLAPTDYRRDIEAARVEARLTA